MWHINRNGQTSGPFSVQEMQEFVRVGKLAPIDLVWKQGMDEWAPAIQCFQFTTGHGVPLPPARQANPYADNLQLGNQQSSNSEISRIGAALLAIFLGGLGIHKFYLGYSTAGAIMLAITICSCGIGGILVAVLGLIEGIVYLSKSEHDFYWTYVQHKREWM